MSTLWKDVIAFCEKAIENTSLDQDELREKISNAIQDVRDSNTLQVLFAHRWDEQLDEFTREPDLDELEELKAELGKVAPLKRKNIGIKFCPECNNMLYPAQHMTPDGGRLQYECKVKDCGYSEFATDTCIYINRMTQDIDTLSLVNSDMASDPTLQHTRGEFDPCPECNSDDAVRFQTLANRDESGMRLYFVCCNKDCGHKWVNPDFGVARDDDDAEEVG
eukprot:m.149148 g.149148  ORF g.149148 m.149148 type:complete len:221 (-) comp17805_c0_seq3:134-796(-)